MLLRRKHSKQPATQPDALTLRSADNTPLYTFPPEVVGEFRRMVTRLAYQQIVPSRISVVAAHREEGVTYTTLALAMILAGDLGRSVCVVELNWRAPGMHALLFTPPNSVSGKKRRGFSFRSRVAPDTVSSAPASPGLGGVLTGAATLDEALVPTALPNLVLLPAGELSAEQGPAMAHSATLKACLDQLGLRFDHLLLDVPAILASSDAIALASLGAACCVVVRQGVTPVGSVRLALDEVKHLAMLGVVLNRSRIRTPKWLRGILPHE